MKPFCLPALLGWALAVAHPMAIRGQTTIPIHVTIVMHSEQTARYDTNPVLFEQSRTNLYQFARVLDQRGVMFNFQSDWTFLAAVTNYDRAGRPETGGTNIVAWMERDLGFDIDPHNHVGQSVYNYADVAALITACGAHPTAVVGGYLAYPAASNQWGYFQGAITGAVHGGTTWTPGILWGGASAGHRNETNLWFSGVYAPRDATGYFQHEPGNLPLVGGFGGGAVAWTNLDRLITLRDAGLLCTGVLYTCNLMVNMSDLTPAYLLDFAARLDARTNTPGLRWVGLSTMTNLWVTGYAARPSYLPYAPTNDLDADGLTDAWEIAHFCAITETDGAGDGDGDRASEAEEYAAATDPADPADVFTITGMERPEVAWRSVSGRTYAVEVLAGAVWTARHTVVASGPVSRWTNAVWADASWWRIVARPP